MAMNQEFVDLVQEYLADGVISNQEREVLLRKAQKLGVDFDEAFFYIQAQEQKAENAQAEVERKEKGSICPHCKAPLTELADICPKCHEPISPKASKELQEILDNLEDALVAFKSGRNITEAKALVERYARKAKLYYSHNEKIIKVLYDIEIEVAASERKVKQRAVLNAIGKRWKLIAGVVAVIVLAIVIMIVSRPTPEKDAATCVEAVQQAIKRGNITKAENYCTAYTNRQGPWSRGDIESAIYSVTEAYIAAGEVEKAEQFCTVYGFIGSSYYEDHPIVLKVQDAYIKLGKYDEAEKCVDYSSPSEYFEFLCKCLDHIIENDGRTEAKSFIDRKIYYYTTTYYGQEWKQDAVRSRLYQYAGIE